ncbi:hypothetical protein V2J09_009852 [Rumex salicifolius]
MMMRTLSHKASSNTHGQDSSYFLGWEEYEKNPYHVTDNPNGIIQMGLAENQLSFDLLESWLQENPDAAGFKQDGQLIFRELALFQDYHGLPSFKKAMTDLMSKLRGNKVTFNPENLVLTAGATSANETIVFCLADPGEAFLLPTPYYPGFDRDLKWRTGVEIVPIKCTSANGFKITKPALEEAYQAAKRRDLRVKGILLTNPSNPLGTTLTREEIKLLLNFIATRSLHLVADEIYSGTVLDTTTNFLSVMDPLVNDKQFSSDHELHQRVHVISSLSKDLGLPGFRVGSIYSNDSDVVAAATKMSSFGLVSSQTQHLLAAMLSDADFVRGYVAENRLRLRRRQEAMVAGLKSAGVTCLKGDAGLFCWVDMRHLLKEKSFEGEMELWKKILYEVRLNVSPGASCHCSEPGWFRMCFANMSEETLELAMQRVRDFVADLAADKLVGRRAAVAAAQRRRSHARSLSKWVMRLSLDDRELDDRSMVR